LLKKLPMDAKTAANRAVSNFECTLKIGAHDADRTRDLSLTKGVLYH
jgi:hypothetical protein